MMRMPKRGIFLLVPAGCFVLGSALGALNIWPTPVFSRALYAYAAFNQRSREIKEVMGNPYLLDRRRIEKIAMFAQGGTFMPRHSQAGLNLVSVGFHAAMLLDMRGRVLHTWKLPLSKVWPNPPHISRPNPDEMTRFIDVELFPNGDLLAIYHADNDTPYGYGMVKMDKDSRLLWQYPKNVHHDMYVAHDGRIYTLTHSYVDDYAGAVPHYKSPVLADAVAILSPDGKEEDSITIVEALLGTPYEQLLYAPVSRNDDSKHDYTHANSVMKLEEDIAPAFPMFKPGQLLVSLRNINAIIVIDPQTRKAVWGMQGIWKQQHDAQFRPNGHIMLFDNLGYDTGESQPRSRLLEFDPATGAIAWYYTGERAKYFFTSFHGSEQVLPGGNMIVTESGEGNKVTEITPDKQVVWHYIINPQDFRENPVNKAMRVSPDFLTPAFCEAIHCRAEAAKGNGHAAGSPD